jgi:hypothetical protein
MDLDYLPEDHRAAYQAEDEATNARSQPTVSSPGQLTARDGLCQGDRRYRRRHPPDPDPVYLDITGFKIVDRQRPMMVGCVDAGPGGTAKSPTHVRE